MKKIIACLLILVSSCGRIGYDPVENKTTNDAAVIDAGTGG